MNVYIHLFYESEGKKIISWWGPVRAHTLHTLKSATEYGTVETGLF